MKKLIALTLALIMVIGVFVGCSQQSATTEPSTNAPSTTSPEESTNNPSAESGASEAQELEPATLVWYLPCAEQEGSADVIEVFNNKLAEVLPNTTVEFVFSGDLGTHCSQFPLLMAAETPIDLYWAGFATPFYQDVLDGNIMAITQYINENTPNLLAEMEIWQSDYISCTLDGEIYGIPIIQPRVTESQGMRVSKMLDGYLDAEAFLTEAHSNIKTTEKMLDLLEEGIQNAIDAGALDDVQFSAAYMDFVYLGLRGYGKVCEPDVYFDATAENPVPLHAWEIPEYKMCVERMAKWYQMGWIPEGQLIDQLPEGTKYLYVAQYDYNQTWTDLTNELGIKNYLDWNNEEKDLYLLNKPENGFVGLGRFGSSDTYNVVPYTAANPERAVMLLDVLRSEPGTVGNDLINLLVYGFAKDSEEANTYGWDGYEAKEQDGQEIADVSVLNGDASKHSIANWLMSNTYKVMSDGGPLTSAASKAYCMDFYETVLPKQIQTPLANGFVDTAELDSELAAMRAVKEEYNLQIVHGCVGAESIDALMTEAMNKMNDAGWPAVKDNLQAQFDAIMN